MKYAWQNELKENTIKNNGLMYILQNNFQVNRIVCMDSDVFLCVHIEQVCCSYRDHNVCIIL